MNLGSHAPEPTLLASVLYYFPLPLGLSLLVEIKILIFSYQAE